MYIYIYMYYANIYNIHMYNMYSLFHMKMTPNIRKSWY